MFVMAVIVSVLNIVKLLYFFISIIDQTLLSRNSELENKVSLLERRLVQQENVKHAAEQDMQLKV